MVARYDAFLLRIWRSGTGMGDGQWSARLEHLPDGQGLRFRDLELLLAHLRATLQASNTPEPDESEEKIIP